MVYLFNPQPVPSLLPALQEADEDANLLIALLWRQEKLSDL